MDENASQDERFPKHHRLLKRREFERVFKRGSKVVTSTLVFFVLSSDCGHSRLGMSVSRKAGKANRRNRIKRHIREVYRRQKSRLPPCDIVVIPRRGAHEREHQDYESAFGELNRRLRRALTNPRNRDHE